MKVEQWPIGKVRPYAKNPRQIGKKSIANVAQSLREFGWRQPLVVDRKGVLIVGHTRYLAAQHLKLETVPVHVATELSAKQVRAYRIADNRTAEGNDWNVELLQKELATINGGSFTGFSEKDMADWLKRQHTENPADDQRSMLSEQWQILIECKNESEQADLLARLTKEGLSCRALIS